MKSLTTTMRGAFAPAAQKIGMGLIGIASMMPAFASSLNIPNVTLPGEGVSPDKIVSKVVGLVLLIARYIGIVFMAWGLVMLALAMKNEEPESKQKAIMLLVGGCFCIGITVVYNAVIATN